jgi:hypothetical protein
MPDDDAARRQVEREVWISGLTTLADELYELRCEIDLARLGERGYSDARLKQMRERVDQLEPVVGEHLVRMLEREDTADAALPVIDAPAGAFPVDDVVTGDIERTPTALSAAINAISGRVEFVGDVLEALPVAQMSSIQLVVWWSSENAWLDGRRPIDVIQTDPGAVRGAAIQLGRRP